MFLSGFCVPFLWVFASFHPQALQLDSEVQNYVLKAFPVMQSLVDSIVSQAFPLETEVVIQKIR